MKKISINQTQKKRPAFDLLLLSSVLLLCAFSVVNIYSAAASSDPNVHISDVWVQIAAVGIGLVGAIVLSRFDFERVDLRAALALGIFSVIALLAPLFIGVGAGNKSWIAVGNTNLYIQTSEYIKIAYIITLSYHITRFADEINRPKRLLFLLAHGLFGVFLVLLQGDVGSAAVYLIIFVAMLYGAGVKLRYFAVCLGATALLSPAAWYLLGPLRQSRIIAGFSPESDPLGYGWQALTAMNAISNGRLFGVGFGNAEIAPTIPACCTDLMIARICEEFGSVVGVLTILLLTLVILRVMFSGARGKGRLICIGIGAWMTVQTLESAAMTLGVLPIVGVTLPFLSYGGSSNVALLWAMGIVLSAKKRELS
ncbi:MAG: FtsW/RodA/SpoVE family cell cycle protein [Clostridia bacterium]|nr:FtsW/RodA/SpoVE family cell cycle protein [Clostridia bacterium]